MTKERREADKPTTERKEAKKMPPEAGVLSRGRKEKIPKLALGSIIPFAPKKTREAARQSTEDETDALLHDGLSQFERQLILECREDGMSDSEIQKWMQEI